MFLPLRSLLKREYLRWVRAPTWIVAGLLSPILYLLLFGQAFDLGKLVPPVPAAQTGLTAALLGAPNYFSYFAVGMVGLVAVTSALFAGTGVIFDKQLGILQRTIATPVRRSTIFLSSLIFRGLLVVLPIFIVLGLALGFAQIPGLAGLTVTQTIGATGIVEVLVAIFVLAIAFTSLFLAFGFLFARVESYFAVVNLLNLPILFTSNALYPYGTSPQWIQNITAYNPISLAVDVMRENFFGSTYYAHPAYVYLGGLVVWAAALGVMALLLASRALRTK
ncbi:MAG: ABC transporter permease [Thermoplasmata archaeon]|nr:ABC transporter permease [Thermoplasmata archaeon]